MSLKIIKFPEGKSFDDANLRMEDGRLAFNVQFLIHVIGLNGLSGTDPKKNLENALRLGYHTQLVADPEYRNELAEIVFPDVWAEHIRREELH